ncbi:hypothetical protein B0H14DRAFT_2756914, partial [Mycena olivaceomarginata]
MLSRIPNMLPQEILASCTHPPDCPIIDGATLPIFDVLIIGIPTSYGDFPGQRKTFRDSNGPTLAALL